MFLFLLFFRLFKKVFFEVVLKVIFKLSLCLLWKNIYGNNAKVLFSIKAFFNFLFKVGLNIFRIWNCLVLISVDLSIFNIDLMN
jgi:hypothetical protein